MDNPAEGEKLSASVILSVFLIFLDFHLQVPSYLDSFVSLPSWFNLDSNWAEVISPVGFLQDGVGCCGGIFNPGSLSDCFGQRYIIILCGQLMTIVGSVVCCTSSTMNKLIAGEVILRASIGTVTVACSGIAEILPNRYRG